jgi:branched-chain amino acid transport system permease protein
MGFFLETLIGGLMAGMLYSLIALGFVLIFKASGVFNFAQGAMVLFAASRSGSRTGWACRTRCWPICWASSPRWR